MKLLESTSGTGNTSYTYSGSGSANSVSFSNDGAGNATLVISGNTIVVKPGECLDISFIVAFTAISITTTGAWRMIVGE
jgi:hypothetical protein